MAEAKLSVQDMAAQWLANGLDNKQVEAELLKMGIDERNVPDMLREFKKMRNARNTTIGLYYILAGALLCLISCVLTLAFSSATALILYGLTSLGVIIVFVGLARIFG
jgi:VIT1/CCC1 family predicted Fe2+/Mn2+ transporter